MNARLPLSCFTYTASNSSNLLSTAIGLNDLLQEEFKGCKKVHFLSNEKLEKLGYILTDSLHLFSAHTLKRLVYRYGSWKVLKAYRLHGGNVDVLLAKMTYSIASYEL